MTRPIADIKAEIGHVRGNLSRLQTELRVARIEALGFAVGDVIIGTGGGVYGGIVGPFRVTSIDFSLGHDDRPWVSGNPLRKDGTFGTANRNAWSDWRLPEPGELDRLGVKA